MAGHEMLSGSASTPDARLRAALERLVSFYSASRRSGEAETWRRRLEAFDASKRTARAAPTRSSG